MTTLAAIDYAPGEVHVVAPRVYPQLIKYMGSKAKIINFVSDSIQSIYDGGVICDLFSGAASLSGALGASYPILTNDIQHYSSLIASVYLKPVREIDTEALIQDSVVNYKTAKSRIDFDIDYEGFTSLEEFNEIEVRNRTLIDQNFRHHYHLFVKNYSGTWWSGEQCLWIDAIKQAIDKRVKSGEYGQAEYALTMSTLLHAMAYSSQGTGHYAQYRDAKTESSMLDINIYRQKKLQDLFVRKLDQMIIWSKENVIDLNHSLTTLDYTDCLKKLNGGTVYADPPYAFVHYSRFYHAMETLCLYDYPDLQIKGGSIVKGRYREERHQSPFCIRTQVNGAFEDLFSGVKKAGANLALSYSDTAMISLETLLDISKKTLKSNYEVWVEDLDHQHMTMGRQNDRSRDVKELMLLARRK
ncbi:DNA adenine methylase [Thalassolituus oleivorans]|jgi:adenine-specific DNA-methyltransferase|uniref:DNA adenine methylase n=1 Tax=Thalassolituus oleivorans TaxID=187493 RepID=UPI0030C7F8E2